MFTGIDHVVIAVPDLEAAIDQYKLIYNVDPTPIGEPPGAGFRNVFFRLPSGDLELVSPNSDEGPVAKRLASQGPGVYLVAMAVDDLSATLDDLRGKGIRLLGDPGPGNEAKGQVFIHPGATGGVLTQLVQKG